MQILDYCSTFTMNEDDSLIIYILIQFNASFSRQSFAHIAQMKISFHIITVRMQ